MKPPSPRLVAAVYAAVALLSLWSALQFVRESRDRAAAAGDPYGVLFLEGRLRPLLPYLDRADSVGYVADPLMSADDQDLTRAAVRYALAPRLLLGENAPGPAAEFLVGLFSRPSEVIGIAQAHGLRIVKEAGNGAVLFRRAGAR